MGSCVCCSGGGRCLRPLYRINKGGETLDNRAVKQGGRQGSGRRDCVVAEIEVQDTGMLMGAGRVSWGG